MKYSTQNFLYMELLSIFLLSLFGLLQMNDTTEMVFVGDAMQHGPQIKAATKTDGTYDYGECFTLVEDDIKSADYAVANLECPLAGKPYKGYPAFSAPDEYAQQLSETGFDLLQLANNHILDAYGKGVLRTIKTLDSIGIEHLGAYENEIERETKLPYVKDVNGIKIAFLSYTYGTNLYDSRTDVIIDRINRDLMAVDVKKARDAGAEIVCMCLHWGNEYELLPSKSQRSLTEFLQSIGVDLIIGSHPHVVQPMELEYSMNNGSGGLVVYSLGNFISNQNDINSRGGAMAKVLLTRYEDKPVLAGVSYKLFFCQKPSKKGENYKLIPQNFADSVRVDSKKAFAQYMYNTETLLKKNNKNID